ncbi:MAG: DUF1036 domain-containing protein [Oligoflexales bacterium]|nr:DUF1036 domain-containing protein [Oligoflexales bacterium]
MKNRILLTALLMILCCVNHAYAYSIGGPDISEPIQSSLSEGITLECQITLVVRNNTKHEAWVAFGYLDSSNIWISKGWYRSGPITDDLVLQFRTDQGSIYAYAETQGGGFGEGTLMLIPENGRNGTASFCINSRYRFENTDATCEQYYRDPNYRMQRFGKFAVNEPCNSVHTWNLNR